MIIDTFFVFFCANGKVANLYVISIALFTIFLTHPCSSKGGEFTHPCSSKEGNLPTPAPPKRGIYPPLLLQRRGIYS